MAVRWWCQLSSVAKSSLVRARSVCRAGAAKGVGISLTSRSGMSVDTRVARSRPNGSMSEEASKNPCLVWCSRVRRVSGEVVVVYCQRNKALFSRWLKQGQSLSQYRSKIIFLDFDIIGYRISDKQRRRRRLRRRRRRLRQEEEEEEEVVKKEKEDEKKVVEKKNKENNNDDDEEKDEGTTIIQRFGVCSYNQES
ncbi:hypothetical protein M0802_014072 [Mischocyttarus mexicanus]|nr:hypothetical protein M0802_014079 [Mischocyttarus mexicanus]KAI4480987.1 hypothetical protein M0802_014072 [Mischocyttarus mexicanus]